MKIVKELKSHWVWLPENARKIMFGISIVNTNSNLSFGILSQASPLDFIQMANVKEQALTSNITAKQYIINIAEGAQCSAPSTLHTYYYLNLRFMWRFSCLKWYCFFTCGIIIIVLGHSEMSIVSEAKKRKS